MQHPCLEVDDQYTQYAHTSSQVNGSSGMFDSTHDQIDQTPTNPSFPWTLSLYVDHGLSSLEIVLPVGKPVTIGRETEELRGSPNQFSCEAMSKRHAEVWTDGNVVFIRDLGSLNGTFVNGERLSEEDCDSGPYELKTGDTLEMGSTFAGGAAELPGFSATVSCLSANLEISGNSSRDLSTAAQKAINDINEWVVHPGEDEPVLYWFTHPDAQERLSVVSCIAAHCVSSRISSPRLYLSRRSVSGWDLARLLVCQLSHFIPGLPPRPEPLATDEFSSLGEVDENWLRAYFVEPLLSHNPPPMLFIIDSLDTDKRELLRPLTRLAMIVRATPGLSVRFLLATHPAIRRQTGLGPNILGARILKEMHAILLLDELPSPSIQHVSIRQNVVSFLKSLRCSTVSLLAKLSPGLVEVKDDRWRPTRLPPLDILMETIRLSQSLDLILDDLRSITPGLDGDPQFCEAVSKDVPEDERTYTRLLRAVIRDSAKSALELKDGDAQVFVDFAQALSDSGALLRHHGHDFDRKARRLISNVVAASDTLPTSIFLHSGIVLSDSMPFSGGGFADIYRATHDGQNVALKRLRVFRGKANQQRTNRKFCREALTWRPLQHPNVLPFIGVDARTFPPYLCMVSPWMENGTIMDLRKKHKKEDFEVDRLIGEVAEGLEYLHFEKIIHGDLRGVNILIDEGKHVQLADFGLTVHADASIATESHCGGNIRWMAPELLLPEDEDDSVLGKTEETDVYAFACVVLELYQGQYPFYDVPQDATVLRHVLNGIRPNRPRDESHAIPVPDHIWSDLVEKCWHHNRYERPTMDHVVRLLHPAALR